MTKKRGQLLDKEKETKKEGEEKELKTITLK